VPAGYEGPGRRGVSLCRLGAADDRLRAVSGAGAQTVPAVLRQSRGPEPESRRVAVPFAADETGTAIYEWLLRARLVHALADGVERLGQHAERSDDVERGARRDLSVRKESNEGRHHGRFAARVVGSLRLRAACRIREEVSE